MWLEILQPPTADLEVASLMVTSTEQRLSPL